MNVAKKIVQTLTLQFAIVIQNKINMKLQNVKLKFAPFLPYSCAVNTVKMHKITVFWRPAKILPN